MRWRLFILLSVLSSASPALAQSSKPTVFVGPQVRNGFVDIDSGIRDSIQDIKQQLQGASLAVSTSQEGATLVLIVIARGIVTNGSVGFSSAALGYGMVT